MWELGWVRYTAPMRGGRALGWIGTRGAGMRVGARWVEAFGVRMPRGACEDGGGMGERIKTKRRFATFWLELIARQCQLKATMSRFKTV